MKTLNPDAIARLVDVLQTRGYDVIGPTIKDHAIVLDQIVSSSELPVGRTQSADGGTYRLKDREDGAFFGYVVGPHSLKRFLHSPSKVLWKAEVSGSLDVTPEELPAHRYAFLGVRPCDLAALAALDHALMDGPYPDPDYKNLRENIFVVAVNCTEPAKTCFCASMKTGPTANSGYDMVLTEVCDHEDHYFVAGVSTEKGQAVLEELSPGEASGEQVAAAEKRLADAAANMGRRVETEGVRDLLFSKLDSQNWRPVGERCLSCANCTLVCPTCFCTTVEDHTDLTGRTATRIRQWDSCFTSDFSYIHGGSIRKSGLLRYRQWLTHKFASWVDQFGTFGCVGCGRCITWCPVGIDVTEEIQKLQADNGAD